jgi:hypothetical protein
MQKQNTFIPGSLQCSPPHHSDRADSPVQGKSFIRRQAILLFFVCSVSLGLGPSATAQVSVTTYHMDNFRTGLNANETLLTSSSVKMQTFGKLFSYNVDGFIVAQPLYMPDVNIPALGTHNVVYVATQNDSVYAFDADQVGNGSPLWQASFTNPAAGITSVPIADNGCPDTMFVNVGIMGTPVIDAATGTLYVSVKTKEIVGTKKNYVQRLHALDITNGQEKFGGPVVISASVPTSTGTLSFDPLHHNQRPGLLLSNGTLYIAYGSNGCDQFAHGWILAYNPTTLQQTAVWNGSPNQTFGASIWQSGSGLGADANGNIYVNLANGTFNVNVGGSDFGDTLLKLTLGPQGLVWSDYFEPFDQENMAELDLDLGSGGVLLLPDQPGPHAHLMIGAGKTGSIYMVDRESMGQYNTNDNSQIVQYLPDAMGPFLSNPLYWNGKVYFYANNDSVKQYTLTNGLLSTTPTVQSKKYPAASVPAISANGNSDGIVWLVRNPPAPILSALNAVTLAEIYNSTQSASRDALGSTAHFITPIVANGKVFVGTKTQLVTYGLLPTLTVTGGNNQTGAAGSTLTLPLTIQARDAYAGTPIPGVAVTFSDSGKGGSFSNPNATTDSTGTATTTYTLPTKVGVVSLSVTGSGYAPGAFSETVHAGAPNAMGMVSGAGQSGTVGTTLAKPVVVAVRDAFNNPVPGAAVTFSDGGMGGNFSANPVTTNSFGQASVSYTLPTIARSYTLTASTGGVTLNFSERAVAGAPATLMIASGNGQTAPPNTQLAAPLAVVVKDTHGNPVPGVSVGFSDGGAGGTLSSSSATTVGTGRASVTYTTPSAAGNVSVTATVTGITPAVFTVHVR